MSTHTPGPWFANGCLVTTKPDEIYPRVTNCFTEADARLIAAAPELLEALQNCVNLLREVHSMFDPEKIGNETLEDWLKEAKAAIAKAQG